MKKIIVAIGLLGICGVSTNSVFAGYFSNTPVSQCNTQITHTLQVGSENNDVYTLQQMLVNGGYMFASPNGYFGPSTFSAVKRFQDDYGIPVTGVVGEITRSLVNQHLCDQGSNNTVSYGVSNSGVTYVDQFDPYAKVISPSPSSQPIIYSTPQAGVSMIDTNVYSNNNNNFYSNPNIITSQGDVLYTSASAIPKFPVDNVFGITPATTQVLGSRITYNASTGYSYSVIPQPGTLTITTPRSNVFYNEGDTANLSWVTNNLNATAYQVIIENTSTGQGKLVTVALGNSASIVLTKELLDSICSGICDNNQQGNFRFVIATPVTDIAGVTSNFRAMVSPVTIRRPFSIFTAVNMSASKTPVNSGEGFRLYVNTPGASIDIWNSSNMYGNATVKLHAICPNTSIQVSIAGNICGQDFIAPVSAAISERGIPVMITNTSWFTQNVIFEISIISPTGVVMGTSRTTVTSNSAPFSW